MMTTTKPRTERGTATFFQEGAVVNVEAEWKPSSSGGSWRYLSVVVTTIYEGQRSTAHVSGFVSVEDALKPESHRWFTLSFKCAVIEDRTQAVYQQALDDGDDPEPPLNWMQMMEAANAWSN
jgi:hypothetical protein